jgi:cyclohexyl-isocyanide hydratase
MEEDAMKVLAMIYPGMTLLDLVGPLQAWSFLPDYEVQYVWHRSGPVPTDCGLTVHATNGFADAWTDPDVLFVGGGAKPTLDLLGDSAAIAFLTDRGSRARWVCSVCTGSLLLGAAGLLRGYRAAVHWGAREALSQFGAEPSDERVWGPWRVAHRVVASGHTCRPCNNDGCGGGKVSECLTELPVERVRSAVNDLLSAA